MKFAKRLLMVAGAVAFAGMVGAMIDPKGAHALVAAMVQIVPGATTHVGQVESQIVMLECNAGDCRRLFSDGTIDTQPYIVPAGFSLVVTDWEFQQSSSPAGQFTCRKLFATNNAVISKPPLDLFFPESCAVADSVGFAAGETHLTTGMVVGSGMTVISGFESATFQGYLVPNQ